MPDIRYPHILLSMPPEERPFTSTTQGGAQKRIPQRDDPGQHSAYLQHRLAQVQREAEAEWVTYHVDRAGIYLEVRGEPGYDLVTQSLEEMRSKKARLLNVRNELSGKQQTEKTIVATVFISKDEVPKFARKLRDYAETVSETGKRPRADFINSIADLSKALHLESFWTDDHSLLPGAQPEWCEVWLSSDAFDVVNRFEGLLQELQLVAKPGTVCFPERAVKVILADRTQLEQLSRHSDDIAEYRRAKTTATFWTEMQNREQAAWVQELLQRLNVQTEPQVAICLLDTGVNHGHPLLAPLLNSEDCQAVDAAWGAYDHDKHGTLMAGIAAYGDLAACLASSKPITIAHCLESIKLLPPPPEQTAPNLWGYVTTQAVSRAEIQAPQRQRIVCMAVTASDTCDRGRPTSWSAALDQLAAGNDSDPHRLLIVSAGNVSDMHTAGNYPQAQMSDSVHDPAQAWNALTVGACTALDMLSSPTFDGYTPVAPRGGLSPFTTTSLTWDDRWPIKPEIVMEGGNLAHDGAGFFSESDDLSLLSTFYQPQQAHFYPFNMTSAATAQAAWLAAQIQTAYPDLWPETVRALIVHSARWSDTLKQQLNIDRSKSSIKRLLRVAGYGVPDLGRALYSAANSLTLIAQTELQPFARRENGGYKSNVMHFYALPWPTEVLRDLPVDAKVEMRVTLSYFIEPGPGEIGWRDRYHYMSHGLRFELNSPGEAQDEFIRRINMAERDDENGHPGTQSAATYWLLGAQARDKGSIHSDIWQGTAPELAASNMIAVFPRIGWWSKRAYLGQWSRSARYALVVSIATPETSVDLYTPVAVKIGFRIPVAIPS